MRYLYTILLYLATPWLLLRFYVKGRRNPGYRAGLGERFGWITQPKQTPTVWLHAVSLGESIAATPLIRELLAQYPQYTLLVTTTTPTGYQQLTRQFGSQIHLSYAPLDLPDVIHRFWQRTQPKLLILMETELWPNLITYAARRVPVVLANARLSPRSFKRYARARRYIAPYIQALRLIAAQSVADAERFQQLGAKPQQISVTGNLKFDLSVEASVIAQGKLLHTALGQRPTWIAASTHPGEEIILFNAWQEVQRQRPDALLLLVPRHPERFDAVADYLSDQGVSVARRSRSEIPTTSHAIYLADTVGELMTLYAASDIAFVGGSLVPIGGHNLIEPASLGLPIITGPHLYHFTAIAALLTEHDALCLVTTAEALAQTVLNLLQNASQRLQLGTRARHVAEHNRGAVTQHLALIQPLLVSRSS